ncbi:unnamed protein product [Malus baccata var. baccata]
MNLLFFSLLYPNFRSQFLRLRNPNLLYLILDGNSDLGVFCLLGWEILTGKLVELDGVVDGAGGEAGGVGVESESRGRYDVVGLLVPQHQAIQQPLVAARGLVGLSELQRYLGVRFDLGFESFSSIFVGLLIFLDFGDED